MSENDYDPYMSPEYLNNILDVDAGPHLRSNFAFLSSHNGWRQGKFHVLMGSSHSGKSTLVRSLVIDAVDCNPDKKVLVVLSEETKFDFVRELAKSGYRDENALQRIKIHSELELPDGTDTFSHLSFLVDEIKPDLVVYDNLTTNEYYNDQSPRTQATYCKKIKKLAIESNAPFLMVMHTGADITDNMTRLVEMNDIRGSKTIVNLAEFFYVIQTFHLNDTIFPTIKITKHRGEECGHRLYRTIYDKKRVMYFRDCELSFKEFKKAFKARNHL